MAISTVVLAQGDSLRILKDNYVLAVSVQAPTGSTFTVLGSTPFSAYLSVGGGAFNLQQVALDTMSLTNGEGFTVVAYNVAYPIDNLTITATSGSINVLIQT